MGPAALSELRSYVEQQQATLSDPAERDRALGVVEKELTDLLGLVRTYRNDSQLAAQGANGPPQPDAA